MAVLTAQPILPGPFSPILNSCAESTSHHCELNLHKCSQSVSILWPVIDFLQQDCASVFRESIDRAHTKRKRLFRCHFVKRHWRMPSAELVLTPIVWMHFPREAHKRNEPFICHVPTPVSKLDHQHQPKIVYWLTKWVKTAWLMHISWQT